MRIHTKRIGTLLMLGALAFGTPAAHAQHGHEHGGEDAHAVPEPQSYREAVHVIDTRMQSIQRALDSKQLGGIHDDAEVITTIARRIGRLALAQDSGVSRDAVRDVNIAGRDLANAGDRLHEVADDGNLDASVSEFVQMKAIFAILHRNVPAQYVCTMHCEPGKTYSAPGNCPVCGMDLNKIIVEKYAVDVRSIGGSLTPGKEATLRFSITDPAGGPVKELKVVHEKILHLLMVSKDLSWYAHEHPTIQNDGTFSLPFTFPHAGEFVLFHDFTPAGVGMQVVPVTLNVEGTIPPAVKLTADRELAAELNGYTVHLDTHGPLVAGQESVLAYHIVRDGRTVMDLEPYLGAMGHLVIISEDLKQFVHSHPIGEDHHADGGHDDQHSGAVSGSETAMVSFQTRFPAGGLYKAWAQFKHRGRILTVPFVVEVGAANGHHAKADDHDH